MVSLFRLSVSISQSRDFSFQANGQAPIVYTYTVFQSRNRETFHFKTTSGTGISRTFTLEFPSRNRETFHFKKDFTLDEFAHLVFPSRNRETFHFKLGFIVLLKGAVYCFNLAIERLFVSSVTESGDDATLTVLPSRNRGAFRGKSFGYGEPGGACLLLLIELTLIEIS